ncbi:hypothetical protein PybrP1_010365 [[Pythium] brassicae (nom. inval.)]|nr:hypothetical protein PybrP1_010365 [[Pythium] brassicae (nom. inval.)]
MRSLDEKVLFFRSLAQDEPVAASQSPSPSPDPTFVSAEYVEQNLIALSVVLLVSYGIMCLLCAALVSYMRYNRHAAHNKGDSSAARKILLPAFEPLLWILGAATGSFSAYFAVALSISQYQRDLLSVPGECFYAGRMFMLLLAVVLVLQKSVTLPALRRAVLLTLALSTYSIPVAWFVATTNAPANAERNFWVLAASHALVLGLFAHVAVFPPGRASKATLRQYCAFVFVQQALEFAYMAAFHWQKIELGFALPKAKIAWENPSVLAMSSDAKSAKGLPGKSAAGGGDSRATAITVGDSDELGAHMYQEYSNVVKDRGRGASEASPRSSDGAHRARPAAQLTVKGTADYMAPEVINGRAGFAAYGEAADVYSLAITMWDILHPGADKYPDANKNHLLVYEAVIAGSRPALDAARVHPGLRAIISLAWAANACKRPSAQQVVAALERIQEEVCAVFALELQDELEPVMVVAKTAGGGPISTARCFSGQQGITLMRELGCASTSREALRLGNLLMDAGFLHHIKHARGYEYNDALYFFDDDNLQLCQPFAMLDGGQRQHNSEDGVRAGSVAERERSDSAATEQRLSPSPDLSLLKRSVRSRTSSPHSHRSMGVGSKLSGGTEASASDGNVGDMEASIECDCQKLGQRLDNHKAARRRFRRRYKTIPEENLLTVTLLNDELSATQNARLLDEFSETGPTIIVSGEGAEPV